jgi:hypothetical protein
VLRLLCQLPHPVSGRRYSASGGLLNILGLCTYSPATARGVISDGYTFYADKVYISFEYVMAQRSFGYPGGPTQVGQTYKGRILTMESADVSSMRRPDYGIAYSFNFADLNSPFPWSALAGMWDCYVGNCATISQDYRPEIEVPPEVRQLDPERADCALDRQGLYDPSHALTLATAPIEQHTPAAPSSSIQPNWAPSTTSRTPTQIQPTETQPTQIQEAPRVSPLNPTTSITAFGGGLSLEQARSHSPRLDQLQYLLPAP